jgi:hypothetical protein
MTGPVARLSDDAACEVMSSLQAEIEQNAATLRAAAGGRPN